ncbi:preprotein translocase subunit SecG [Candidatus Uhrbacteria bacterium CG10_big_fil_rev_8_21_14_0_10_48_11]|uniref:Protein-export membrane protein SecG n=1 Tax=Candidatus Uhrbacteria bacterium CG10_big_fil_rev_8_21_14_0_10_48_11 TaxID=1975037 RepID=A0A2M8LFZ6_9BACT|nr:MAG: preprotein translocase subunit SecG [Candidatus Uhrbacteria bacterium CG10_big_fil_rev_8_21_14_0_10_48_11]
MDQLKTILPIVQIVISILLIITVLLQQRGSEVGGAFGGGGGAVYRTKRGIEKTLFRATIALGILFAGASLLRLLI